MICRDEAEAAQAAEELKKYVKIVETDLEKAEFGDGVMVLPVSYTKGLEFDAVLLFDPTQENTRRITGMSNFCMWLRPAHCMNLWFCTVEN